MKTGPLKYLFILFMCFLARSALCAERADLQSFLLPLIKKIPLRPDSAMTGTEFAKTIFGLEGPAREQAVLAQLSEGNLPDYLRKLKPVQLSHRFEDGKTVMATIFVMPDYLSIGVKTGKKFITDNGNKLIPGRYLFPHEIGYFFDRI